jgi:hypothetical protein
MISASKHLGVCFGRIAIGTATFCLTLAALFAVNTPQADAASSTIEGRSNGGTIYWSTSRYHSSSVVLKFKDSYVVAALSSDNFGMSLRNSGTDARFTDWKYWVCYSGASGYFPDGRTKEFGSKASQYFKITTKTSTSNYSVGFSGVLFY